MSPHFNTFNSAVDRTLVDALQRNRLVTIALAVVVAQSLPVPTSPVENPGSYYITSVSQLAKNKLYYMNEGIVFDAKAALEYARAFWMLRYTAVHASLAPMLSTDYCFFSKLFGCDVYISPEDYVYMNNNKTVLTTLCRAASDLLKVDTNVPV